LLSIQSKIRHVAKLKLLLALFLLVSIPILSLTQSTSVSADEVKWSRVHIPAEGNAGDWQLANGSDVQHLTMSANGNLFAYVPGLTYTLYQSTDGGKKFFQLPATAWQGNLDLDPGTTYYWKVRAISADTKSAWSAVGTFTTELPSPSVAQPSAPPTTMTPLPAPSSAAPSMPPTPPQPEQPVPPALSTPSEHTPDWVVYLIGALILVIILLIATIVVLAFGLKRS
jgi:hypothetical protein